MGNIYQVFRQEKLTNGNLFPILEVGYHVRTLPVAEQLLPNTMRKLRNGDILKILAWGDSITEGEYVPLPQENCWQSQLVSKLHERFPAARLELVTSAWGNHNSNDFLQERAGAAHNYVEQVIDVRPDLVISEFLNDRSLTDAQLDTNYRRFLVDFRAIGAEWLILTPPYTAKNAFVMMPPEMQKQVKSDERRITAFLRRFAIENHLPLAEAGERFVALPRQGIPHLTVMVNNYNHPGIFGLSLLADAALQIFPER
ncbi:MAG: SGNH/GDSL hydrolase family protein [Victivallales bacterium]|nr:SGNH/GDSL hydrolase family protein [Victivallales bacterium]